MKKIKYICLKHIIKLTHYEKKLLSFVNAADGILCTNFICANNNC